MLLSGAGSRSREPEPGAGAGSRNRSRIKVGPVPQHCGTVLLKQLVLNLCVPDSDCSALWETSWIQIPDLGLFR